ncbi:MAG: Tyrosine recombinase XerC [Acidimicrobiales bacterium]|nr:Tyrosine recombinase XerC [Acidimicrobiales bacterium]
MQGYVARKGDRYYAVIYEGIDPLTGRDRRRWYPAGTEKTAAEALASDLADRHRRGGHERSSLTVAVYLTQRWLPAKKLALRPSTWDAYRRVIDLHLIPRVGRIPLRQLRPDHLERLYADLLDAGRADGIGGLQNKTVVEIHMILRRALDDAVRRGWIMTNPAKVAHAPKRRPLASNTSRVWNAQQLGTFLASARDHRYHAAIWVTANTGMRRGEILGLRWGDVDFDTSHLAVTRSLVSVGYELHETRGKSRTARRPINLDPRTLEILHDWRQHRANEDPEFDRDNPDAHVFARPDGQPTHPQLLSDAFQKLVHRSGLPRVRFHDLRHTHATLLLKAGVPIKVVSERLGHSTPGFTMATYQHVIPGMQQEAAHTFAGILAGCADLPVYRLLPGRGHGRRRPDATRPWPGVCRDQGRLVAGAGFEPATFGL